MPNILDQVKQRLEHFGPTRVRNFLHRPLGYGTVLGILIVTGVMTALFWKTQSPEVQEYAGMSLTLTELKYYDAKLDAAMENARILGVVDTMEILLASSVLRELGNGVSNAITDRVVRGGWVPDSLSGELDRQLLVRLLRTRVLVRERVLFARVVDSVQNAYLDSLQAGRKSVRTKLDAIMRIRQGADVSPAATTQSLENILETNHRQLIALQDLRRTSMQSVVDEMILQYQERMTKISRAKEIVNVIFYMLSIMTVLAVLVLLVRLRR